MENKIIHPIESLDVTAKLQAAEKDYRDQLLHAKKADELARFTLDLFNSYTPDDLRCLTYITRVHYESIKASIQVHADLAKEARAKANEAKNKLASMRT